MFQLVGDTTQPPIDAVASCVSSVLAVVADTANGMPSMYAAKSLVEVPSRTNTTWCHSPSLALQVNFLRPLFTRTLTTDASMTARNALPLSAASPQATKQLAPVLESASVVFTHPHTVLFWEPSGRFDAENDTYSLFVSSNIIEPKPFGPVVGRQCELSTPTNVP